MERKFKIAWTNKIKESDLLKQPIIQLFVLVHLIIIKINALIWVDKENINV